MAISKEIVVLAASRKRGSLCYAGKEMIGFRFGSWVRPVTSEDGSLALTSIQTPDGSLPACLDAITVELDGCCGLSHQTENWLLCSASSVTRLWRFLPTVIPLLSDAPDQLWHCGYSGSYGVNDRVPERLSPQYKQSLYMVELDQFRIRLRQEFRRKPKLRGCFVYNNTEYALTVTDPDIEQSMRRKEPGEYVYDPKYRVYGCISLGLPWRGDCYKLLAAVYLVPKGT